MFLRIKSQYKATNLLNGLHKRKLKKPQPDIFYSLKRKPPDSNTCLCTNRLRHHSDNQDHIPKQNILRAFMIEKELKEGKQSILDIDNYGVVYNSIINFPALLNLI